MKVILNTDIPNLGEEGDVLEVKPGYARNYLIPNNLVSLHNKTSVAVLESKKKLIEKRKQERKLAAQTDKTKIDGAVIEFKMPAGENGKLFGAVTAQMIVEELEKQGITIERKKVEVPGHTLKTIGEFKIHVRLYHDTSADLKVKVVSEDGKAEAAKSEKKEEIAKQPVVPVDETQNSEDQPSEELGDSSSSTTEIE
jgi:large subunit ribosomal protein L9